MTEKPPETRPKKTSMKKIFQRFTASVGAFLITIVIMMNGMILMAQRPTHIPGDGEPVGFFDSLSNIIFFIVIPVFIVVIYILYRRYLNQQKEKMTDDAEESGKSLD
jgi:H+/gluconate symporter-like permease